MRTWLGAALLLTAAACGGKVVSIQVTVVDQACSGQSPFGDGSTAANYLQMTVTGDGIATPLITTVPLSQFAASVPQIPTGQNRMIEVRAYQGDPRSGAGNVVSIGKSVPFKVPTKPDPNNPVVVTVFLRRVGQLTKPNLASAPQTCSQMMLARAGHTATLMQDGTVFIAGGFELGAADAGTPPSWPGQSEALDKTEVYDPSTGIFGAGPTMATAVGGTAVPLPRAFHSATLLQDGQVLLIGGEQYRQGFPLPLFGGLDYDPGQKIYGPVQISQPRAHHAAAIDKGGRVLVVGGQTSGSQLATNVEWFDPSTSAFQVNGLGQVLNTSGPVCPDGGTCPLSFPRLGMGVAAAQGGQLIAVAGGWDGTVLSPSVNYFNYSASGSVFQLSNTSAQLPQPRFGVGVTDFQNPNQILVVGGYASVDGGSPDRTVDVVATDTGMDNDQQMLSGPRGDICSVQLADGRVLSTGGRTLDNVGYKSDPTIEVIAPAPSNGASVLGQAPMATPRYWHTCTLLSDGSVLLLGGVQEASGVQTLLQDALIYMPCPASTTCI